MHDGDSATHLSVPQQPVEAPRVAPVLLAASPQESRVDDPARARSNADTSDSAFRARLARQGEIEVNGHPFKVAWHVSIHDGVDTFSGDTVFANVFADNSGRGFCLVVGTADAYMTARVNPGDGRETAQFEVCDNDRGKPQNSRTDAMRWRAAPIHSGETGPTGDTGLTYLTGGNIVEHGS